MSDDDMIKRINTLIEVSGMNQSEFSKMVGIDQGNMSKILRGDRPAGDAIINKIALSLKVNKNWLLTGDGDIFEIDSPMNNRLSDLFDEMFQPVRHDSTGVIGRIKELISYLKVSYKEFANSIGVPFIQLNKVMESNIEPSLSLISTIGMAYPEISKDWLLNGNGGMIKLNYQKDKSLALYDVEAAAGYESFDVMIEKEKVVGEFVIPTFKSADWMIYVRGASMYPKYSSGDIIACKEIKESRFIQWNKVYVVATREQGLLVKRLMPSEKEDFIKAVSDNEKYPPFDIPKDEIFGIALVLGAIRLE